MTPLEWLTSAEGAGFFAATTRLALPVLLAALGGIYNERAGVVNVGMEGMMLAGAFAAFAVGTATGSVAAAVVAAVLSGMLLALVLGLLTITLPSDQVVTGIALSLMCLGVTSYLNALFGGGPSATDGAPVVSPTPVPGLADVPVLGPLLFQQSWFGYAAMVIAVLTWFVLRKTAWGMNIRACGEHPEATETLGVSVARTRYLALTVSGALAGLGGAFLTLVESRTFLDGMTSGRGYIALAILILGAREPLGVVLAALLFGAADAAQLRAQVTAPDIPVHLMLMVPYVLTVLALVFVRRSRPPAALGVSYRRGKGAT